MGERIFLKVDYYDAIKKNLIKCEIYDKTKDFLKDRNRVITYYENGRQLSRAGKEYGKNIIKQYSERLIEEVGEKFNERTLYRMRKFYEVFSNEKLTPVVSKLSWSHYVLLLSMKDVDEIIYYINITLDNCLSKRELQRRISNDEYSRLGDDDRLRCIEAVEPEVRDFIPNPIIFKLSSLQDEISEYALKQLILGELDEFLSQLGRGFSYVGSEYKIKLGNRYNFIDLLLYNIKFRCYVVVELKVTELKKEHMGQITTYMNYIDDNVKTFDDNRTVGIIVCKQKNEYVVRYCSDDRVITREYKLIRH